MEKTFNEIRRLPSFERDLKWLMKRFRSLEEDLEVFISSQLKLYHKLKVDNGGIVPISGLGIENPHLYKARKFACKSLKGSGAASGIRIIYAYFQEEDIIEFVEIYYKGDKENEDRERIIVQYGKC